MKYLTTWFLIQLCLIACTYNNESPKSVIENKNPVSELSHFQIEPKESAVTWILSSSKRKLNGYVAVDEGIISIDSTQGKMSAAFSLDLSSLIASGMHANQNSNIIDDAIDQAEIKPATDSLSVLRVEIIKINPAEGWLPQEIQDNPSPFQPASYSNFVLDDITHILKSRCYFRNASQLVDIPATLIVSKDKMKIEARFNLDGSMWPLFENLSSKASNPASEEFIHKTLNVGLYLIAKDVSI